MEPTIRTVAMLVAVVLAAVAGGGVATAEGTVATSNPTAGTAQTDCSFPVSMTDFTGTAVTVEDEPQRIVVLQPSDAQTVWSLNASDRVVGMPQGPTTAYLNDTANVTNIRNTDGSVDVEQVTNLSADLVLAANVTRSGTVDQLRSAGQEVYYFDEVSSMAETYRNINTTGRLIGNCGQAADVVASMQSRLSNISEAVAGEEEPRALYVFYGYAAGNDTHLHSMIEIAGGENIADDKSSYYEISPEVVAERNPQWIVQPSGAPRPTGAAYNGTTAIQEGQVLTVNANYANQAGPRVVRVVETMAQAFHPEAFDENGDPIVSTPTATATPTATPAGTDTPEDLTATTEGSGPGFTTVASLIAVLAATLALGYRRKGV